MIELLLSYFILGLEIIVIHSIPVIKQRRKVYFIFFFLQFFLLAGFRGLEIHNDTISYVSHFNNVSGKGHFWEIERELFNIGYLMLEKFIHNNITDTILGFNLFTSFVICFATIYLFYRKAAHIGIAIFLYFISGTYFGQVAVLRESFAVIIGYICILQFQKKQYLLSIPFILLAISLHNSAFILVLLLLLDKFAPNQRTKIIIAISIVVITIAIAPVMEMVLNLLLFETKYYREGVERGFASANGIFNGVVGILVSYGVYQLMKSRNGIKRGDIYSYILYVYFLISLMTLRLPILSRYQMFFTPFIIIIVSNLAIVSSRNKKYALFVAFVMAGNIIVKQIFRPEWISIFPYSFYSDSQLGLLLH